MSGAGSNSKKIGKNAGLLVVILVVVALAGYIYWSPYQTLHDMRNALKTGQVDQLDQDIDYSSVREGLKRDFRNIAVSEVEDDPSIKNRLLGILGLAIGAPIADTAIDYIVSPAGLRRIVSGSVPILSARSESATADLSDDADPESTPDAPSPYKSDVSAPVKRTSRIRSTEGRYVDINRFVVTIVNVSGSATALTFTRRGPLSWQLTHVKLMPSRQ